MSAEGERERWDFFISRAGADGAWAEWIAWQLEAAGYSTVLQDWDFAPGENFVARMRDALDRCEHTIAVLSDAYFRSPYCEDEWTAAFARDEQGRSRLLPVRVEACQPPLLFTTRIFADLAELDEPAAKARLLDGVSPCPREAGQAGRGTAVAGDGGWGPAVSWAGAGDLERAATQPELHRARRADRAAARRAGR